MPAHSITHGNDVCLFNKESLRPGNQHVFCTNAELWAEANPLDMAAAKGLVRLVRELPPERKVVLGMDTKQVVGLDEGLLSTCGKRLQVNILLGT